VRSVAFLYSRFSFVSDNKHKYDLIFFTFQVVLQHFLKKISNFSRPWDPRFPANKSHALGGGIGTAAVLCEEPGPFRRQKDLLLNAVFKPPAPFSLEPQIQAVNKLMLYDSKTVLT
jgi:hypothetical protein